MIPVKPLGRVVSVQQAGVVLPVNSPGRMGDLMFRCYVFVDGEQSMYNVMACCRVFVFSKECG